MTAENERQQLAFNIEKVTGNVLRTFAMLFVFVLHGRGYVSAMNTASGFLGCITLTPAWAGVWIFFFLSGFGVGVGLFNGKYKIFDENSRLQPKSFLAFYLKRFLKIAPLYYAYCLIFVVFSGNTHFIDTPRQLIHFLTFTLNGVGSVEGIGHLWYVSTAMQLYLLMPFIFLLLRKIPDKVNVFWLVFALVAALGLGLRFLFLRLGLDWYSCVYTLSLMNLDIVAIGMLVAKMKSSKTKNALGGHHKPWFIVSVVFFIALSLLNCYLYYVGNDICFRIYRYVFPSAYTIASAMLILSSPSNARLKAGACSVVVKIVDKISAFCSKYSYAIYICHIAVFRYVSQILQATSWFLNLATAIQFLLFMVISFVVTVLIAMIFSKLTVSKRAPSGSKN